MEIKLKIEKKQNNSAFSLYEAGLATLLFIVFNISFMFLYKLLPISFRANKAVYYICSFLIEFLFAVTSFVVAKSRKIDFVEACGLNKKFNLKIVCYGFLISVVCLVAFSDLTSVFLEFLDLIGYKSVLSDFSINTFWEYLIYIVITCLTPAVCEEILFRGTILSGLKSLGKKATLLFSAFIFMIMHGNPDQTVHQFIIGLVVGYLFLESGNIWLGVIVHFFNNFIAVTQVYLLSKITITTANTATVEATSVSSRWVSLIVSLVIALIIAYFGYLILKYLFKKVLEENDKLNKKEVVTSVSVDGAEVDSQVFVDGQPINDGGMETLENSEFASKDTKKDKRNQWSLPVVIMFSLSISYLVFDWLTALIYGLL